MVKGNNPVSKRIKPYTLKEFIEKEYAPWRKVNRKRADEDIFRLQARFESDFCGEVLADILPLLLDRWQSKRVASGIKPITVNRDIAILKALLSKAEEWGILEANPYLSKDEESRLRQALMLRDEDLKAARNRGNKWKTDRGYDLLPDLYQYTFADYMTPMILLSVNTGLRRGELFNLCWKNVNFDRAVLTVEGETAKSGKTRHLPLNAIALQVLKDWQVQNLQTELIFSSHTGNPFNNVKKAWASILKNAEIQSFRWHDMRHHFASKLVMAGVDLNTVRELLGHSDIKMTLRYAHLAPEHKANAVAKLLDNEQVTLSSVA